MVSIVIGWLGWAPTTSAAPDSGAHLQVALGHAGPVVVGKFSPDGARVATGSDDQTVNLWDADSGVLLYTLAGHRGRIVDLAWSPDGSRVATASDDGTAAVWERRSGRLAVRLEGHTGPLGAVVWSPDGTRLLTRSDDGTAMVWDGATGRRLQTLAGHAAHLTTCAWSPDGTRVLTGSADGRVLGWKNGAIDVEIKGIGPVYAATFSTDGARIATASRDGVAMWNAASGASLGTLEGHFEPVFALAFSPDGRRFATGSWDRTVRIWDPVSETPVSVIQLTDAVMGLAWSPDGSLVLVATRDGRATVWDAATGDAQAAGPVEGPSAEGIDRALAAWSPDGLQVLSGRQTPVQWDPRTGEVKTAFTGRISPLLDAAWSDDRVLGVAADGAALWDLSRGRVGWAVQPETTFSSAALAPDGRRFATTEDSGTVAVWDARTGELVFRLAGHTQGVKDVSFSPDGTRLLTAGLDNQAIVWDLTHGTVLARVLTGQVGTDFATWSTDGTRVVTTSDGRTALWDSATGALLRVVNKRGRFSSVAPRFSPTGQVAAGGRGTEVLVWNAAGKRVAELVGHQDAVTGIAWSPDGRRLATASDDGTAAVWDATTGERVALLSADGSVADVAFSSDGAHLLTASHDHTAGVWDTAGTPSHRLEGHLRPVRTALFSPGDRYVLTASADGTQRLWDAPTGRLVATLAAFGDGSWAVVDPYGRFDGSDDGAVRGMYWVIGGEAYELAQLRNVYYEPGLLAKLVGGRNEPLRNVPPLLDVKPPPTVTVTGPTPDGGIELRVMDRGGGIGPTTVWLNGSDISDTVRKACPLMNRGELCRVDLSSRPTWVPGVTNRVQVRTADATTTVQSRRIEVAVQSAGAPVTDPPDLWVLAVGTSDYAGDGLDLRYAGQDAQRFGEAMAIAGARGFGAHRTHVRVLSTEPGATRPTRAAVEEGFAWLRTADPQDTVVVFFAGRGKAHADAVADDYYYLLTETSSWRDLADPAVRARRTWSGQNLADVLALVPAQKRLVIFDTCEAGGSGPVPISAVREVSSDTLRAYAQLRERTGAWLLLGAVADQASYEATRFSQGLLTYTLLEAMQGPALDGSNQLQVSRWVHYAEDHVPAYAVGIGGVQRPYVAEGSENFLIGEIPLDRRARIPIGRERPLMVRARVVDGGEVVDPRGFEAALDRQLRALADSPEARFVWMDAATFAGAWRVTGQVRKQTSGLVFEGFLTRGMGDGEIRVALSASGADVDTVAAAVADLVGAHLR